jgi:hypothetical protein
MGVNNYAHVLAAKVMWTKDNLPGERQDWVLHLISSPAKVK